MKPKQGDNNQQDTAEGCIMCLKSFIVWLLSLCGFSVSVSSNFVFGGSTDSHEKPFHPWDGG